MINARIVADSSANLAVNGGSVVSVPLKIITDQKEYVDDANLNTTAMVWDLQAYTGKSSTACPSPQDWLEAFADAPYVFCIAITSNLSGSCNAATIAKADYEVSFPDRKVCVIDSLSTGGEMELIAEKLQELIAADLSFEEIEQAIHEYQQHTGLMFMLESMQNLANNGRVNKIVAKAAGILGIRAVGKASDVGTLEPMDKCRGEKKALAALADHMVALGYDGGKMRISHCLNPAAAESLKETILAAFPDADVQIRPTGGLCSFYAEKGGMIIGFEK
jgi:DegV family protein with EDD domain